MIEMRLALIVGHTQKMPGAMGVYPIDRREYDWNLDLARIVYKYAKECGLECKVFLRDHRGLEKTYKEVNEWCGNTNAVAVELHFNACDGKSRGTETLWDDEPSSSVEFARIIHDEVCAIFNRKFKLNRGLKKIIKPDERGYVNLKLMKVPGCIIEPGFGDNAEDALLMHAKCFEYAQGIAKAAFKYMVQKESESVLLDKQ